MDFFGRQQQVRRMSARLVVLFVVAVIGIIVTVSLAVITAFGAWDEDPTTIVGLAVLAAAVTGLSIGLASLFRTVSLRGGGGKVAIELGGVLVPQDTTDPQLRRLRNVVEEIAIASGVPVPQVYVLPQEQGINAFAAGWSPTDAAVAVTQGSLDRLNRDELQGVIAHEFSHVLNGDMRLNIRLIGLLFGILFLTVIGRELLRWGFFAGSGNNRSKDGEKSGGNPLPLIGLAMVFAGLIGVFAGRLIQASVSRQREYLADASAVQFTRQTSGIAGALKKIAGLPTGSQIRNPREEEVGHMLFGSGRRLTSLFATHPPLADRIKVLEPEFDPAELDRLAQQWAQQPPDGQQEDIALGFAPPAPVAPKTPPKAAVQPSVVVTQVAAPTSESYERAGALLGEIPADVLSRARDPRTVAPLTLGLLMAEDASARDAQYRTLQEKVGLRIADAALAEANELSTLAPAHRLPLAEIAFPALRSLATADQQAILGAVFALIHADGRITVFEYCLSRLLLDQLQESMSPKSGWREPSRTLANTTDAALILLAVLAQAGAVSSTRAQSAFDAGVAVLLPGKQAEYVAPPRGIVELESVWASLDGLVPDDKSRLVQAIVAVIASDGTVTVAEGELLRTVCSLLHCPLPPLG
ncbi:MAG: M48 family metallopeptidase [Hamadaea sp.]|uniref:M48 family metallopeptidase n=1 Tax=Hamadaea sp. TaxID=2024425 RepID=UPI001840B4BA|nr:M48 family metallopeptidase [Hamadaea sp.]NUR73099.1 M48 family metallopeptidase [Hamadaea sp.]NUT23011.1 M48 family metallopeptidase [Hamadaea sp.]